MNPRRHLELAQALMIGVRSGTPVSTGTGDVECRCVVGRSYYCAFLVARDFLNQIGLWITPTSAGHNTVQYALNNSGVASLRKVGSQLEILSTERNYADYEPSNPRAETVAAAEAALSTATTAIQMLDIILAGRVTPPLDLAAVANTILAWARANGQESKIRRL
jgi:hypothetical protein